MSNLDNQPDPSRTEVQKGNAQAEVMRKLIESKFSPHLSALERDPFPGARTPPSRLPQPRVRRLLGRPATHGRTNRISLKPPRGPHALEAHRRSVSGDQRMAQTRPAHLIRRAGAGRSPQTHVLTRGVLPPRLALAMERFAFGSSGGALRGPRASIRGRCSGGHLGYPIHYLIVRIYAPRFFGVGLSSGTIRSASTCRFTAGAGGIANHELRHNHHVARGQVWFCLAFEHCVKGGDG